MTNSIQQGFWGSGMVDGFAPYAEALKAGISGANGTTPLGQLKYYEYRLGRKFDFFRWRQAQGFQSNGKVAPSIDSFSDADYLLNRSFPGHDGVGGNPGGTIVTLEYTWGTKQPNSGISAASIIRGNFDFGPRARMVAGSVENGMSAHGAARWAARPRSFTAPSTGVSYGARSYDRDAGTPTDFPATDAWVSSFNPNSIRSGTPGSYSITAGSGPLQTSTKDCYSLFETGLDVLYLTSLYPNAMFIMDMVLEVNLGHQFWTATNKADYPKSDGTGTSENDVLGRANYADACLHIIAFLEAMGIDNIYYTITLGGQTRFDGPKGNNGSDPWWGNILAQEKNDIGFGAVNSGYATNRTWVHLAAHDAYCGMNGQTGFYDPYEMNHSAASSESATQGITNWCHTYNKYFTLWTTGVAYSVDTAAGVKYPKDGNLKQSGSLANGDNFFSAYRLVGDQEMATASPRYWGCLYQETYESQNAANDYSPESDSRATHNPPTSTNVITSGDIYGLNASGTYDPTTLPTQRYRKGWRAYWDWLNAPNFKGGTPLLLPTSPPTNAPTITSISPRTGVVGTEVTITGTNFTGTTSVKVGSVAATSFTVDSATSIRANVPAGGYGAVTVTTSVGSDISGVPDVFAVKPTLGQNPFAPTSGPVGTSVVITGTGFSSVTAVMIGLTAVASYTINSDTQLTAVVAAGTASGTVKVTAPGGTATSAGSFTVTPSPSPTITSFSPTSGVVGASVVITGTAFTGTTAVKFNGVNATFIVDSATQITATAPAGGTGTIAVTNGAGTGVSSGTFTISNAPTITSFAPTSGPVGTSVTITGTNFSSVTSVKFNNVNATSYSTTQSTQITAVVPTGGSGSITVTAAGGTAVSATAFTLTPGAPTITSFSPTSGAAGASVVITGTNFTSVSAVRFNGVNAASFTVNSTTQITAVVPAITGATGPISVVAAAGTAISASTFTVTGAPTITSFTPTSGPVGTSVVITGTNLTGASVVKFNGVNATSYTVNSATQITAAVPAGGGGTILVTTSAGSVTSAGSFALLPPPAVLSFTPTTGAVGASVVITGQRFTGVTGAAGVKFNGVNATSYTVNSDTQITAVVPANGGGLISVTSPNGTGTSASNFTLTAGPTVTSFSPISGAVGTTITFVGTNLAAVNLVHFGAGSGAPTSTSSTGVVINVPTGATTAQPILDTPSSGSVTAADPFTVTSGSAPTISSFTPTSGAVGTTVDITGTNFSSVIAVRFEGQDATSFVVNSTTHIHAVAPISGSGKIEVHTAGGIVDSSGSFTIVPVVDTVTPETGAPGSDVLMTGSGFSETVGVSFGAVPAWDFALIDDATLRVTVPFGIDAPITVFTPGSSGDSPITFAIITDPLTEYAITYYGATGWAAEHVFEMVAEVTSGGVDQTSKDNPTDTAVPDPVGIWFVDRLIGTPTDPAVTVQLLGQDDLPSAIGESATQFTPVGRPDPITITDSTRGYEGTVSGYVQSTEDLATLEAMKTASIDGKPVRLIASDMNIPVLLGALTIGRVPTEAGFYPVSVAVTQVDEFSASG